MNILRKLYYKITGRVSPEQIEAVNELDARDRTENMSIEEYRKELLKILNI